MRSIAKLFARQMNDTKVVVVEQTKSHPLGECYENAVIHRKATGSKIVNGWIISDGSMSVRPSADAILIKHYWNRLNGRHIDTTSVGTTQSKLTDEYPMTYIECKRDFIGDWIDEESIMYVSKEKKTKILSFSPPTRVERDKINAVAKNLKNLTTSQMNLVKSVVTA